MILAPISDDEFVEKVNQINWKQFNGPEYYKPYNIVTSLSKLASLTREDEKWDVYNDVLFAIGNNHAGTYYPVIIDILPLIIRLLKSTPNELVRNCILQILSEWYYSFEPEIGAYKTKTAKELDDFVRTSIKQAIIDTQWNESKRNTELISSFIDYFNEEA